MYVCLYRMGGLGNQLFQYAAARVIAETKNYRILIEGEVLNHHNHHHHDYVALLFRDAESVYSIHDKLPPDHLPVQFFEQPGGGFSPWSVEDIPTQPGQPVRIGGYFQYLPTLSPVLPGIRSMFWVALRDQRHRMSSKYGIRGDGDDHAVFMHVRRGDYTKLAHIHYVQDESYYEKAVAHLSASVPVSKVYVLSDDMEWCTTRSWSFPIVPVEDSDELQCLAFMSLCKGGAIIGNSTFSWWGAILGDPPHVCYPSRWIEATVYNLFPSHWTKME